MLKILQLSIVCCLLFGCTQIIQPDLGVKLDSAKIIARRSGRISFSKASVRRYSNNQVYVCAEINGKLLSSKATKGLKQSLQNFAKTPIEIIIRDTEGKIVDKSLVKMYRLRQSSANQVQAKIKYLPKLKLTQEHIITLVPRW